MVENRLLPAQTLHRDLAKSQVMEKSHLIAGVDLRTVTVDSGPAMVDRQRVSTVATQTPATFAARYVKVAIPPGRSALGTSRRTVDLRTRSGACVRTERSHRQFVDVPCL